VPLVIKVRPAILSQRSEKGRDSYVIRR